MAEKVEAEVRVYRLHLALEDISDRIWRRLLIPGDWTLSDLHSAIQVLMGWDDEHLHSFTVAKRVYEPASEDGPGPYAGEPDGDDSAVTVSEVLKRTGQKCLYTYDFGDNWEVDIKVEAVLPPDPAVTAPVCLDGRRSGPPEDCGGAWGYKSGLATLSNPDAEDYEEVREWYGDQFDPEAFDLEAVNKALARFGGRRRSRRSKPRAGA